MLDLFQDKTAASAFNVLVDMLDQFYFHGNFKVDPLLSQAEACFFFLWQTSKLPQQGRLFSSQKVDSQNTLSFRSQMESGAGKRSLPAQRSRHQDQDCVQLYYMARGWREAKLQRAKTTFFCRTKVFSKGQQHRLSLSCTQAKMATLW